MEAEVVPRVGSGQGVGREKEQGKNDTDAFLRILRHAPSLISGNS